MLLDQSQNSKFNYICTRQQKELEKEILAKMPFIISPFKKKKTLWDKMST